MENKPEKCATCKPLTNGDKIRAMSDNELADVLSDNACCAECFLPVRCNLRAGETCKERWLTWLRSPVEESHE